jgi:hypothetical protein
MKKIFVGSLFSSDQNGSASSGRATGTEVLRMRKELRQKLAEEQAQADD